MIPKNRGENFSSGYLHPEFLGGRLSRYAATPLIVALSPGHSDITRFRPWSPIATGNRLDRAKKNPKFAQTTGTVTFMIRVQVFPYPLRGELPHGQICMNDGPNPLSEMPSCSAIDLAEIRRSSKISS